MNNEHITPFFFYISDNYFPVKENKSCRIPIADAQGAKKKTVISKFVEFENLEA